MNKLYKRIRRMQDMIDRYNRAGYYTGSIDLEMSDKIHNTKTATDREIWNYCQRTKMPIAIFYKNFPELDKKLMGLKFECRRISDLLSGDGLDY